MEIGNLKFKPLSESTELVAKIIKDRIAETKLSDFICVAKINPELADTASFCKEYDIDLGISTNCLIIEAKRSDKTWYAACLVLATDMADINGIVRRKLEARKTSFASMNTA